MQDAGQSWFGENALVVSRLADRELVRTGAWRRTALVADTGPMRHEGSDPPEGNAGRSVRGPAVPWGEPLRGEGAVVAAGVRLRREFKGLTVRDLLADQGLDEQLPGRVASALENIRRCDYAAAERDLPGDFGKVLEGPNRRCARRRFARWIVLCALAIAVATATMMLL